MRKFDEANIDGFELSDDSVFNVTESYLLKRYDEFNKKYFDNLLKPVNISITKSRSCLGSTKYSINRHTYEISNIRMTISTYYGRNERTVCATLIHEMIHVYQLQLFPHKNSSRSWEEAHGGVFEEKMNWINSVSDWDIQKRESEEEYNSKDKTEAVKRFEKNNILLVYKSISSKIYMIFCSKTTYKKLLLELKSLGSRPYRTYELLDASDMIERYQISRSLRGYVTTLESIDTWVSEGKIKQVGESTL